VSDFCNRRRPHRSLSGQAPTEREPAGECAASFVAVAVDRAVGPASEEGADEAVRFAVGARPVGLGAEVLDPERLAGERVDRGAVGGAVACHQLLDSHAEAGEVRERAAQEADRGDRLLVVEHFDVDETSRVASSTQTWTNSQPRS
jgi:hypothetical protein